MRNYLRGVKQGVEERGEVVLRVPPAWLREPARLAGALAEARGVPVEALGDWRVVRRSWDARRRPVVAQLTVRWGEQEGEGAGESWAHLAPLAEDAPEVVIVGAGPAGLYAALHLCRQGIRPVIVERGAAVRERRRDLVRIVREHEVDPDSNYCFGEGGAGTYSDGKLYTRSSKRGDIRAALQVLVDHGADPDILIDAHPHIGTNKLPGIIESMRETLLQCGARIHFRTRLTGWQTRPAPDANGGTREALTGVEVLDLASGNLCILPARHVILATGHSARDIFRGMHARGWQLEAKPFALGVRIEHPQALIDREQYHGEPRGDVLPPASYTWTCQALGHGVHSFCMCPGGIIAPCATAPGEVVTNGWSPSKRNNPFANSGIVVQLGPEDWEPLGFSGPLGAMEFQSAVERRCFAAAGGTQRAPAQRLLDFLARRSSRDLPPCSYLPGLVPVSLWEVLPDCVARPLAEGLRTFGKRMPAYLHPDAVLVAPESRTSSPVRIPRSAENLQHPDVAGLYPCGEGPGYAGGILSAAMDGVRVAQVIAESVLSPGDK